jgi:hypothetical protein
MVVVGKAAGGEQAGSQTAPPGTRDAFINYAGQTIAVFQQV